MPTYRLHYFDIRGRGESIRLLFSAAGQKFEDKRYTPDEWNHFKPKTPFGQLPVLDIDGKLYGQSGAIGQYLARAFGLYGKNNIDALNIDIVLNCTRDFVQAYSTAMFEKDEDKKKELMAKLLSDVIPSYITQTENLIGSSGYFVGNSLTYADIGVYDTVDNILRLKDDAVNNSPKLLNNRKMVESNPRLSTYLKNRK